MSDGPGRAPRFFCALQHPQTGLSRRPQPKTEAGPTSLVPGKATAVKSSAAPRATAISIHSGTAVGTHPPVFLFAVRVAAVAQKRASQLFRVRVVSADRC